MKYLIPFSLFLVGCEGHVQVSNAPIGNNDTFELRRAAPDTGGAAFYYNCYDSKINRKVYIENCDGLSPEHPKQVTESGPQ